MNIPPFFDFLLAKGRSPCCYFLEKRYYQKPEENLQRVLPRVSMIISYSSLTNDIMVKVSSVKK